MISINCAELMSVDYQNEFLGEIFCFRTIESVSLNGRIGDNIDQIWSGISDLTNYISGGQNISINGIDMGLGIVKNIDFAEALDVISKPYNINVEFIRTGNLFNLTGQYYSDMSGLVNIFSSGYISNIDESYTFSNEKSGQYNFNKSLSFEIDDRVGTDRSALAKQISYEFFNGNSSTGASNSLPFILSQYPDFYNKNLGIRSTTESFDVINGKYSFDESFVYQTGLSYSWDFSNDLSFSEGITTVKENGTIKSTQNSGLTLTQDSKNYYANYGWTGAVQTGIWDRVSTLYNYFSGECTLKNIPISKTINRNSFLGEITYDYTYTDDPKINESGFSFSKDTSISFNDPYVTISENGNLVGFGADKSGAFVNILDEYENNIKPNVKSSLSGAYAHSLNLLNTGCYTAKNLSLLSSEETFKEWDANLSYSFEYSDNPEFLSSGNFYKISKSISDNKPVHLAEFYQIINNPIVSQTSNQSSLGSYNHNIQIVGNSGILMEECLSQALSMISIPTGIYSEYYIDNLSYNYNPFSNTLTLDSTHLYTKYREMNNIIV